MSNDKQKAKRILSALVATSALLYPTQTKDLKVIWQAAIDNELKGKLDLPSRVTLDWNGLETTTAHIERLAQAASIDEIIALAKLSGLPHLKALHKLLDDRRLPLWASWGEAMERWDNPGYLLKTAEERKKRHSR